jgi:hypothetical protein
MRDVAAPAALRASNEADTAASLRAESVLRPEQRDRARDIAERFREDLYEQRAGQKRALVEVRGEPRSDEARVAIGMTVAPSHSPLAAAAPFGL